MKKGSHYTQEQLERCRAAAKKRIGIKLSEETRAKMRAAVTDETKARMAAIGRSCVGEKNYNWNGGRSVDKDGYMRVCSYGKRQRGYEHRIVAERALGRKLKREEVVHHINGNKTDNRNKNLLICSVSYHRWLENKMSNLYKQEHFNE